MATPSPVYNEQRIAPHCRVRLSEAQPDHMGEPVHAKQLVIPRQNSTSQRHRWPACRRCPCQHTLQHAQAKSYTPCGTTHACVATAWEARWRADQMRLPMLCAMLVLPSTSLQASSLAPSVPASPAPLAPVNQARSIRSSRNPPAGGSTSVTAPRNEQQTCLSTESQQMTSAARLELSAVGFTSSVSWQPEASSLINPHWERVSRQV